MKTAIVYVSLHHGNTKKLADAIAEKHPVALIDGTRTPTCDLSGFDRIGFASGVAFGKLYRQMNAFIEKNLPEGKAVFFLYTCGSNTQDFSAGMAALARRRGCPVLGVYGCAGYDTFGPFKLVGGLKKGHPNPEEIQGAVDFYDGLKG